MGENSSRFCRTGKVIGTRCHQNATSEVGTTHSFSYDVVGRPISEAIDVLGDGSDDTVLRLDTAYDTAGLPYLFTSCDLANDCSSTHVVNQVQRAYNGLGQLTAEYQEHDGEVSTSSSLNVQYAYSEMSSGNHSRLTDMTYPNGSAISYVYGSSLDLDDTISRLTSITSGSTTLEEYAYLGLDTVVTRTHPRFGNDIGLTYVKQSGEGNSDAGDPYTGFDRFGRVVDQRWIKSDDVSNPLDRFQYGYDRDGNRLYKDNLIDNDFDELYHANGDTNGYDLLNQLVEFNRGALSDTSNPADGIPDTVSSPDRTQEWDLDAMGNWESITTDSVEEERVHNQQNQVTDVEANELDFDDNGNTTTDEQGNTLVYDAWNRLVSFDDGTDTVTYAYDALGRRTERTQDSETTDFYYSDKWQVLEERVSGSAHAQYVWSPVYVDALIVRDRDADSSSGNGLEERVFVLQDANFNVTAIANAAGTVQERYVYDPYGTPTRLTASWGTPSSDPYNWVYLHQGGRYDAATGLYQFRNRDLSPTLGRWMQVDPLGQFAGDSNIYRYVSNDPLAYVDPSGEAGKKYPVSSTDPECKKLASKILNLTWNIQRRLKDLQENRGVGDGPLKWACAGDDVKPRLSQRGHLALILKDLANLGKTSLEYLVKCCGGFPLLPPPVPVPTPPPFPVPIPVPVLPTPVPVPGGDPKFGPHLMELNPYYGPRGPVSDRAPWRRPGNCGDGLPDGTVPVVVGGGIGIGILIIGSRIIRCFPPLLPLQLSPV